MIKQGLIFEYDLLAILGGTLKNNQAPLRQSRKV